VMHVHIEDVLGALRITSDLPTTAFGGGVTGFLTRRVGLSWELRRFGSFAGKGGLNGASFGNEQLSFWRINMAVVFRY